MLMLGPTLRYSDLIGLESSLGIRGFQISPDDFKVQQSLRTTNNLLKVIGLTRLVLLTPEPVPFSQELSLPVPAQIF